MAAPIRDPGFMAGTPRSSGDVQTGEVMVTRGGGRVVSASGMFSGNPDGIVSLYSGQAGRLNSVYLHQTPGNIWSQSGIAVTFFDAGNVPLSGGPFPISGHKLIAVLNAATGNSGQITTTGKFEVDMPFQSGLWARAASGAPGFSVSITPECNILDGGGVTGP